MKTMLKGEDVAQTLARLGKVELQWATLTWLLCDIYMVVASEARAAISEALANGKLVHDRGWLRLGE